MKLIAIRLILVLSLVTPVLQADAQSKPIIVLDPGHSGKAVRGVDTQTGLNDYDYPNHPEMEEAFRVAKDVGAQLERTGYKVIYTKQKVDDTVSLRKRATIAQNANAVIGVSIHNDHGRPYKSFGQVYAQSIGQWRGGSQSKPKAIFKNQQIASTSESYAKTFAEERTKVEEHLVSVTPISFNNRPGIEPGNIPQVMLFAGTSPHAVPWVYNEVGGIGFGKKQEALYAKGLANAIEKCVPIGAKH
jgi:N-acetylmuramoyl-L-alanine amidase